MTSKTHTTPRRAPAPARRGALSPRTGGPLLVAVAFDHRSDPAVRRAVQLASRLHRPVQFVHVVDDHGLMAAEADGLARDVHTALHERLAGMVPDAHAWKLRVLTGRPVRELTRRARDIDAAAVLLGSHKDRGLLDFGSTARSLLTHARCPVWVQPLPTRTVRRILVPVDLSEDSAGAAAWARDFGREIGASRTLLHCIEPPRYAYPVPPGAWVDPAGLVAGLESDGHAACERFRDEHDPDAVVHVRHGIPARAVIADAEDHDLVVMGTHGRGALSAAVLGSTTYSVLRDGGVPVVAIRHASRFVDMDDDARRDAPRT